MIKEVKVEMIFISKSTSLVIAIFSSIFLYLHFLWRSTKSLRSKNKIPEPNGALPFIGHLHLLNPNFPICKQLAAMADTCGPIFSLKLGIRNLFVISDCELAKECLTTHDRELASRARIAAGKYMGYNDAVLPLAPYGDYWRHMRKMLAVHVLSDHRLKSQSHVRLAEIDLFMRELAGLSCSGAGTGEVNLSELLEYMTFNINLKIAVGKRFSSEEFRDPESDAWRYVKAVHKAVSSSGLLTTEDAFPWLAWLDLKGYAGSMKETGIEIDEILGRWLEEHLVKRKKTADLDVDREISGRDFMDVMLSMLPEDTLLEGHTRDIIIKATALIVTLNGGESMGVSLTWTISLLLNHPNILKALQEEIDGHVGKQRRWVQESDIGDLNLLQAVVKESLRLYPPGPLTGIREAAETCRVGGYQIPKGSWLVVNIWKLQRDPRVLEKPETFVPERWLMMNNDLDGGAGQVRWSEYLPFSSGRRACPGVSLAMNVVQLTLARLVQGFDVVIRRGSEVDMEEGPGLALPKKMPLNVALAPRFPFDFY